MAAECVRDGLRVSARDRPFACTVEAGSALTAKGDFSAILPAREKASPRSIPCGTTWLISPNSRALNASMGSAVRIMRSARLHPIRRGKRCEPPNGGAKPSAISALQNSARSLAIASGAASVISLPPPWARPFTATMMGLGNDSIRAVNGHALAAADEVTQGDFLPLTYARCKSGNIGA